jgi:molecular chaperone DnaK (HSP70)
MGSVFSLRVSHTRFLRLLDLDRPAPVTRLFTTLADGQRKAIFHFFCRQRSSRGWQPVGRIEWDSLPSGPAGEPTLELRLIPGSAGNLQLRLRERSSGATGTYQVHLPWRPRPETRKKAATPNHNK